MQARNEVEVHSECISELPAPCRVPLMSLGWIGGDPVGVIGRANFPSASRALLERESNGDP
jgi:hypothetical protein